MTFRNISQAILSLILLTSLSPSFAILKPAASLLMIDESQGGGSINVENVDNNESLLYVKIINLPDDPEPKLIATQPVMRVGAGKTQRVRFILNSNHPLEHEHLKRVIFEGINPKTAEEKNTISLNIRHNIPVIIHPKNLPPISDPWKELVWSQKGGTLTVNNPGKYVVRLAQSITILPSNTTLTLNKSYVLPGQAMNISLKKPGEIIEKVNIETLSKYGYETGRVDMTVTH